MANTKTYIFAEGKSVYSKLKNAFKTHKSGKFILAPSGAGKSHYIKHQTDSSWVDADEIWIPTGCFELADEWWNNGEERIREVFTKCDLMTIVARRIGFRLMGAMSNYNLVPDAIVLPPWKQHTRFIEARSINGDAHGLKSEELQMVKEHRKELHLYAKESGTMIFDSIEDAVEHCESA